MSWTTEILDGFLLYLIDLGIIEKTAKKYRFRAGYFVTWCEDMNHKEVRYPEITEYIRYCRDEGKNPRLINSYLRAVRHFFDYLNKEKQSFLNPIRGYNPASSVQVRDVYHTITVDYLSEEELDELYQKYDTIEARKGVARHKIMLGLMVYQGLKVGEIERLEKIHFDFKKGTVYILEHRRSGSRTMKLETVQLYDLMEHMVHLKGNSLLGKSLQNQASKLCKELKQINPKVRNSSHLRGSRISYWVRNLNIREAQYLAGHTTISGTEKYRQVNLENLQNQVNKFHPLK